MHKTKNDLPLEIRTNSIEHLQSGLVQLLDLSLQAKQAHWNLKGLCFIALHELFDKVNEELLALADLTAERIAALGGVPDGTIGMIQKESKMKTYPINIFREQEHLEVFSENLSIACAMSRSSIDATASHNDLGTSDLFTEASRKLDHLLWLIESHLQA